MISSFESIEEVVLELEDDAMIVKMADMIELEEKRHQAMHTLEAHQK